MVTASWPVPSSCLMAATLSGLVEPAMTLAPAWAKPSAMARPMPLVPPVTRQTLFETSRPGKLGIFLLRFGGARVLIDAGVMCHRDTEAQRRGISHRFTQM